MERCSVEPSGVARIKKLCGYCLNTLPKAVSRGTVCLCRDCEATENSRIMFTGRAPMATLCSLLLLHLGLLALFLALSPHLCGRVVAITAAAIEQRQINDVPSSFVLYTCN